ncbi:hypothetical protein MTO96_024608, partial [Rhipicephalus appendiculatus]
TSQEHHSDIQGADRFTKMMSRGLAVLFLVCCALLALTVVNAASAQDTGTTEPPRRVSDFLSPNTEWEPLDIKF